MWSGDGPTPIYIWAVLTELSRLLKTKKEKGRKEEREEGKRGLKVGKDLWELERGVRN